MFDGLTFTTIDLTNPDLSNADVTNMLNNTSSLQKVIVANETIKTKLINGSTGISDTKLIKIDGELEVVKTVTINNDRLNATTLDTVEIKFTSNGNQYVGISYIKWESGSNDINPSYGLYYLTKIDKANYEKEGGPCHVVYTYRDEATAAKNGTYYKGWSNEAYKTIEFYEEPTGDLLNWLNANMVAPTSYNISFKVVASEHGLTDVTIPKEIQDIANSIMTSTSSTVTFKEIENFLPYSSVVYEGTYTWYFSDHIKTTQLGNEIVYTLKWYCMAYLDGNTTQALEDEKALLINSEGKKVNVWTITYTYSDVEENAITTNPLPTTIRSDEAIELTLKSSMYNVGSCTGAIFEKNGTTVTIRNATGPVTLEIKKANS